MSELTEFGVEFIVRCWIENYVETGDFREPAQHGNLQSPEKCKYQNALF